MIMEKRLWTIKDMQFVVINSFLITSGFTIQLSSWLNEIINLLIAYYLEAPFEVFLSQNIYQALISRQVQWP